MKAIKIIKIITIGVLCFMMIALTSIGYLEDSPDLVEGSINSTTSYAALPAIYPTILLVIFGISLFLFLRKATVIKFVILALSFLLWTLSGRMIAIGLDGRLTYGWFNILSEDTSLCDEKSDCETMIYYQTKTEKLSFWRIRVKNKNIDEVIFAGPLLWGRTVKLFDEIAEVGIYSNRKLPN